MKGARHYRFFAAERRPLSLEADNPAHHRFGALPFFCAVYPPQVEPIARWPPPFSNSLFAAQLRFQHQNKAKKLPRLARS
jgi:hypothetical protein